MENFLALDQSRTVDLYLLLTFASFVMNCKGFERESKTCDLLLDWLRDVRGVVLYEIPKINP